MLEFLRPAYLWAGALLALLPVLLHLIARKPPARAPLPTARFLRPDPDLAPRIQRRPTDLLLLLLRSGMLLLLGAASAGPVWSTRPSGRLDLVLLDRAGPDPIAWAEAVDSARVLLLPERGSARGDLILFDTGSVRVPASRLSAAFFDSLSAAGPVRAPLDYAAALRAIQVVAGEHAAVDSLRLALVTRPAWAGWSDGLARLRSLAWAGRIRVVEVREGPREPALPSAVPEPARVARVVAGAAEGSYATAALTALGWRATRASGAADMGDAALYLVLSPGPGAAEPELLARARAGAVVVVAGEPPRNSLGDALPWENVSAPAPGAPRVPGVLVLPDGTAISGAAARAVGRARAGARTLAVWEDGRAAVTASREGAGCLVFVGTALEAGSLPLSAEFPVLVDRLAHGCEDAARLPARDDRPLDTGARAVLEGVGRPAPAASLAPTRTGRPLGRWALLMALALAGIETGIAYRGSRR